jgi:predicted Rossmann fold nucleotide-binding protein DprA/Smf involved in DNA uptake
MKTIGIIGSRRRDSVSDYKETLKIFNATYEDGDKIVSGHCAKGGDKFAEIIADKLGLTESNGGLILHRPDKSKLDPEKMKKNPKWAYAEINFARNTDIAEGSDVIIAVVADDRKGGTEDTIKKAIKMGKEIVLVPEAPLEDFDPLEEI